MNSNWGQFESPLPGKVPPGKVVGVIYIDALIDLETSAPSDGDDSLHATLCRLAGLPQPASPPACQSKLPRPASGISFCHLAADTPQLSADLVQEYQQIIGTQL